MKSFDIGLATSLALSIFATLAAPHAMADTSTVRASAPAMLPSFSVSLFTNTGFQGGKSFALFSDAPDSQGGGIAADVRLLERGRLGVSAHAELMGEESEGAWSQGTTRFGATSGAVGAALDVRVLGQVRPYAQLTAGVSSARVRLSGVGERGLSANDTTGFVTGALGLRLATRPQPWWRGSRPFSFSGFAEAGYTAAPAYDFTLNPPASTDPDSIPFEPVPLGQLERSRAQFRVGVGLHF